MTRIPTRKSQMMRSDVNRDLLVDKLCERWVVERASEELHARAIEHARRDQSLGQLAERLIDFQRHEKEHAEMLEALLRQLGREPSRESPSARVAGKETDGLLEVGRRDDAELPHVLQALLAAELIDVAGWELLVDLARDADLDAEWLRSIKTALAREKEHVHFVKTQLELLEREELASPTRPVPTA
jgi:rubrerythrin